MKMIISNEEIRNGNWFFVRLNWVEVMRGKQRSQLLVIFRGKSLKFFKIENPHYILRNAKTSPHLNKRKTLPTDQLNLAENFRVTYKSQSRMRTIRKSLLKPYIFQPTLAVFNPKKTKEKCKDMNNKRKFSFFFRIIKVSLGLSNRWRRQLDNR